MKPNQKINMDQLNLGRTVSVIFGQYAGITGKIVSRKDDLLRVRVSPPDDNKPPEIAVRVDDIKFI